MKILICITELNYRLFQSVLYTSPDTEKSENSSHDPLRLHYRTSEHTFTFMHLADAFIQSDLQCIQAIHFFVITCVPWESNPQPLHC